MNNLKKVLVVGHPDTGEVITMFMGKNGGNFGKIRVDQSTLVMNSGFARIANRSAFITVDEETAAVLSNMLVDGQPYPLEGQIVVNESTEPFYPGQKPKTKGAEGAVITNNGQPVYRDTEFTTDMTKRDVVLDSDSSESVANTANAGSHVAAE